MCTHAPDACLPPSPDVSVPVLAKTTPGFSGADLSKMVNTAKIYASLENKPRVTMSHLERAKDEMILGTRGAHTRRRVIMQPVGASVQAASASP